MIRGHMLVAIQWLFVVLAGAAAWFLCASVSVGWHLRLPAVANGFARLVPETLRSGFYGIVLSVGMLTLRIGLFERSVIAPSEIKLRMP